MAIQTVKVGAAVNDGTGDPSRTCFTKINSNFTDTTHAASRLVGIENEQIPDVNLTKKASGRVFSPKLWSVYDFNNINAGDYYFYDATVEGVNPPPFTYGTVFAQRNYSDDGQLTVIGHDYFNGGIATRGKQNNNWSAWAKHWHTLNTTVDSNGFIKAASPIVKLFADKIECNDEANLQPVTFEKLGVGNYLVKGSTGFAQDGWYVEMPKDANGNALVAVFYKQLANNDISVKTYAKMFDEETGDIVANTAKPRDIPTARWIDLRLQALPQDDTQPLDTDETVATNAE